MLVINEEGNRDDQGRPHRVEELWAFVVSNPDGSEGIAAFMGPTGMMPMVVAEKRRADMLRGIAQKLARDGFKQVRMLRFTTREEIEVYEPGR